MPACSPPRIRHLATAVRLSYTVQDAPTVQGKWDYSHCTSFPYLARLATPWRFRIFLLQVVFTASYSLQGATYSYPRRFWHRWVHDGGVWKIHAPKILCTAHRKCPCIVPASSHARVKSICPLSFSTNLQGKTEMYSPCLEQYSVLQSSKPRFYISDCNSTLCE